MKISSNAILETVYRQMNFVTVEKIVQMHLMRLWKYAQLSIVRHFLSSADTEPALVEVPNAMGSRNATMDLMRRRNFVRIELI